MRFLALATVLVALPACQGSSTETVEDAPPGTVGPTPEPIPTRPTAAEIVEMGNMPDEMMEAEMPVAPEEIARGTFSGASGHDVSGEAVLYRLDNGSHVVRLEGLDSDNGPDLEVWLVRRTSGDVGRGGVSLGDLKSTRGNQNYTVPASVDVSAFAGVSVWCKRFSVNFGTAPLAS